MAVDPSRSRKFLEGRLSEEIRTSVLIDALEERGFDVSDLRQQVKVTRDRTWEV